MMVDHAPRTGWIVAVGRFERADYYLLGSAVPGAVALHHWNPIGHERAMVQPGGTP
jgi:hypothetical protein